MKSFLCVLMLLWLACPAFSATFVYVSVGGDNHIAVYQMNETSGELTPVVKAPAPGGPGSLATDPKKKNLFAALRNTKKVGAYEINPKTGKLKMLSMANVGINPVYLATDRTGKYLLTASYSEGKVQSHALDKDGNVEGQPITSIDTDKNAHSILTDRSNQFVFVPHTGPNAIYQFLLDPQTGKLTPNTQLKVMAEKDQEPRHLWFHPKLDMVYVANEKNGSVTAYSLNTDQGRLKAVETLSTLPKDFKGNNTCAHIEMTPDGKFLYVSNRGHDSLAGYSVDAMTGKLTALGQTLTEKTPRAFTIDPSGNFLYAAGQSSGKLAAYRIDSKTGQLKHFATYEVGKGPAWVTVVSFSG